MSCKIRYEAPRRDRDAATRMLVSKTTLMVANMPPITLNVKTRFRWRISVSDLPRHQREARSYDFLWGITTPVDVIVFTRAEFQRTRQVKTSLAATVQAEGRLLYG